MQYRLKNKIIVNLILLLFFLSICISNLKAQLIIANQGTSAATITSSFVGTGLTISNPVLNCSSAAYGTFSGGTALATNYAFAPSYSATSGIGQNIATLVAASQKVLTITHIKKYSYSII